MPVVECDVDDARAALEAVGAEVSEGNSEHELWRARHGDAVAVAYEGKVVVQGASPQDIETVLRGGDVLDSPEQDRAHVYFDGAARGNPGPAAVGYVVVTADGIVAEDGKRIGRATNNQAEYRALIAALETARDLGFARVDVRGDSELIVRQVRGQYDANDPELREFRVTVRELLENFEEWSLKHVPRESNDRADELANEALDGE
jgi:ribonuclease HI